MSNPFYTDLDRSFRGKVVRAENGRSTYRGVVSRINHNDSSVVLYDCETRDPDGEWTHIGAAYLRTVDAMHVVHSAAKHRRRIHYPNIDEVSKSPFYPGEIGTPPDDHIRGAYRNGFTGSFPVCRMVDDEYGRYYELINGHKRLKACEIAGLEHHPVEVIECTDEEAKELVRIAHRQAFEQAEDDIEMFGEWAPKPESDD
jgi:ParB family chromosome partitioning protein